MLFEGTLSIKPKWFGPPSGSFNQETVNVADELDMKTILWTVRYGRLEKTFDVRNGKTSRIKV